MIVWVFAATGGGLAAGYALPWVASVGVCGLLGLMAAEALLPPPVMLYFAAGCLIALASPAPASRYGSGIRPDSTSFAEGSRLRASRAIEVAFQADAPLAKALLVADQSEIPHEMKARYSDAGIVHMLSISGLHVTIVAGAVALVLQLLRLPVRVASIGAAAVVVAYIFVLGFPPPAVRSAVMVTVVALSHAFQRHTSRWCVLALGGLLPLLRPETALDLGYQLSVAGMAALIAAGALIPRTPIAKLKGWRRTLARSMLVSTVATMVTAPIVAANFGRLSIIAPFSNLVADPVLALAQPILFASLLLAPWPAASRFVAGASHPLLYAFDAIATWAARVPYAAIAVTMSPATELLLGIAALALVVACASRFPSRALIIALGAICATLVW